MVFASLDKSRAASTGGFVYLNDDHVVMTGSAAGNVTTNRHGYVPRASGNSSDVFTGLGVFGAPSNFVASGSFQITGSGSGEFYFHDVGQSPDSGIPDGPNINFGSPYNTLGGTNNNTIGGGSHFLPNRITTGDLQEIWLGYDNLIDGGRANVIYASRHSTNSGAGGHNSIFGGSYNRIGTAGAYSVLIGGRNSTVDGTDSYSLGSTNSVSGGSSGAIGVSNIESGNRSFVWGVGSVAWGNQIITVGYGASNNVPNSIKFGGLIGGFYVIGSATNILDGQTILGGAPLDTPTGRLQVDPVAGGRAIHVPFITGSGNGEVWFNSFRNAANTDSMQIGGTSSAYTTGGGLPMGNSEFYAYLPSGNTFNWVSGSRSLLKINPSGGLTETGSHSYNVSTGTAYTLNETNHVYLVNVDAQTVTLPSAVNRSGREYLIKTVAPAVTATIATTSSQKIDGATTYSLSASNKFVRVISDNAAWWITGSN